MSRPVQLRLAVPLLLAFLTLFAYGYQSPDASGTWVAKGSMAAPRSGACAAVLPDGRVLITGGLGSSGARDSAELFSPDGGVLIVGGSDGSSALASTDLYDPAKDSVEPGPRLSKSRMGLSATALLDGRILVAGGNDGAADLASAEIFDAAANRFLDTGAM